MGQLVSARARIAGDDVGLTITSRDDSRSVADLSKALRGHDAAIDFSVGGAVPKNAIACALALVPLVEGTTGWSDRKGEGLSVIREHDGALVYGANFSIGVNVFFNVVIQTPAALKKVGGDS